jgi:hypothetical protein
MHGATLGEMVVRAIDTANDGRFSLIISTEKPKDIGELLRCRRA